MATPVLAEIRIISFPFAPQGWALCEGQLLPISQNQALYSILGTMYGGDGQTTFALPDLRGRAATHVGMGLKQGSSGGVTTVTLTIDQMPAHSHTVTALDYAAVSSQPAMGVFAKSLGHIYGPMPTTSSPFAIYWETLTTEGGGKPHQNMQPSSVLNFMIALQGTFPERS